ncbi:MAG: YCF48-related protein [Bacteroidota bacterium]
MKIRMAFALLLLFSLSPTGQAQWSWRNPLPQGNGLFASWFINSNLGYLVGDQRTVMKTTDGGATWTTRLPQVMDVTYRLNGVCFPDLNTGYIINLYKEIYKSDDAGETWQLIHSEPGYDLFGVYFTDPLHGCVVCSEGRILRTSDGGATWIKYDYNTTEDLTAVWFPDSQTGFVAGGGGLILRTTDGGNTWSSQVTGTGYKLTSINFTSPDKGIVCGVAGTLLITVDGGNNWTLKNMGDTVDLYSVSMMNADTVFLTGNAYWGGSMAPPVPYVMRTVDGGNSWSKTVLDNYRTCIFSLHDGNAYLAGYLGYMAKTTDAGASWNILSSCLTSNWISAIDFPTADIGYAVTSYFEYGSEAILKTVNGGDTWSRLPYSDNTIFQTVAFVTADYGCVAGADIYNTLDGGATWLKRYTGRWDLMIRSVCFSNTANATAVGDSGIILSTTNIGQSWTRLTSPTTNTLRVVCFPDENTGYIGGNKALLKSVDGGVTWAEKPMPYDIRAMYFTSPMVGIATGAAMIIRTTDGGNTWSPVTPNNLDAWLYSVHFYDADTGYAAGGIYPNGSGGCVLKTVNGGLTWMKTELPLNGAFYAIHVTPAYKAYVGGDAGFLFGTSNGGITGIREPAVVLSKLVLNTFPNPSPGRVMISYELPECSEVNLQLLDVMGRRIRMNSEPNQQKGIHKIELDTSALKPGVYLVWLKAASRVEARKVVVL